jgi:hypothetical protein
MSINDFPFLSNAYSEELYPSLPSEAEFDEVMRASAADEEAWQGYEEWSAELEQRQFERELEQRATVQTSRGQVLIKSECAHKGCGFTCDRKTRIDGVDV